MVMESTPHISFRPPRLQEALSSFTVDERYAETSYVAPAGPPHPRNLTSALRRLGDGRRLLLPAGLHPCEIIARSLFIRGTSHAAVLKGPVRIQAGHLVLNGLEIHAASMDAPALILEAGSLVLDSCNIKGGITCKPGTRLFLRNCLVSGGDEAISADRASVETISSRFSGSQIGIALRQGSSGAFYATCIQECSSGRESDWGAGIFAEASDVYCQAVTFSRNDVAAYLKDCASASLFFCLIEDQRAAGIVSSFSGDGLLSLRSCRIIRQTLPASSQLSLAGGRCRISFTSIEDSPASALTANNAALELNDCVLSSGSGPALDMQGGSISSSRLRCESSGSPAFLASEITGSVRSSRFLGQPPVEASASPALTFDQCELHQAAEPPSASAVDDALDAQEFIKNLVSDISQENIRGEIERILRLAHASRQRQLGGRPLVEQNFHLAFTGSADSGKLITARLFAQGLLRFGIITQPDVYEVNLTPVLSEGTSTHSHDLGTQYQPGSVLFIHLPRADFSKNLPVLRKTVENLLLLPGTVLILDGPRDELRYFIKSSPDLERAFRHFLQFTNFGPLELMTLFVQHCHKDHIALEPRAALCALLLCHKNCDRKDKRFTTLEGVESVYETIRQRYLERCSRLDRFDLPLSPEDFEVLLEKPVRNLLERNPAFASFCPFCSKENPWVNGLGSTTVCAHCGSSYNAPWGLWKDSLSYRHLRDSLTYVTPRNFKSHLPDFR